MFSSLISKFSTKFLLSAIGLLIGIVVALGVYSYFTSSSLENTKEKLTKKEFEIQEAKKTYESNLAKKDEEFKKAKEIYEKNLALTIEITKQKTITELEKQETVKTTNKLKEAVNKRGEIKADEKSNFTIINF